MKKKTVKKFIYFPLAQRGEKTKKEKKENTAGKKTYIHRNVEQNANGMALVRLKLQTDTPTI